MGRRSHRPSYARGLAAVKGRNPGEWDTGNSRYVVRHDGPAMAGVGTGSRASEWSGGLVSRAVGGLEDGCG